MKIINAAQGTPEWHKARLNSFTASEAPAMMGKSKYMTRTELLELKKTGVQKEVSPHTQKIFDRGHAVEALARPIVEKDLSEEFFPVTGVVEIDGMQILASFDGLTMMEDIIFEHKLLNNELAKSVLVDILPAHYYWQLEQQLLVSDADVAVFVVSDGTKENMHSMEYRPVPGRKEELIAGWKQFALDLEGFVADAPEVKHETTEIMALPALSVIINGSVSSSNLGVYQSTAMEVIESINESLSLDEHFAQAEVDVKFCSNAEKELDSVKKQALSNTSDIDLLFKTIDHLSGLLRTKRLTLSKLIKTEKDKVKKNIIAEANQAIGEHVIQLHGSLSGLRLPVVDYDLPGAMKGKRNLASMRDAVNNEVTRVKIKTNEIANTIMVNLKIIEVNSSHKFLFNDLQEICSKDSASFGAIVESRINKYLHDEEQKAEAQRKRIREEEKLKAERNAKIKLEKEREALQAEADKKAEKIRRKKELQDEHEQKTQHELCCSSEFPPEAGDGDIPLPEIKKNLESKIPPAPLPETMDKKALKLKPIIHDAIKNINDPGATDLITITKVEYQGLVSDSELLQALFQIGVDNWEGYNEAQQLIK